MTRKDYVAIANALREARDKMHGLGTIDGTNFHDVGSGIYIAICGIADVMEQDNPRFDRARFLAACGVRS